MKADMDAQIKSGLDAETLRLTTYILGFIWNLLYSIGVLKAAAFLSRLKQTKMKDCVTLHFKNLSELKDVMRKAFGPTISLTINVNRNQCISPFNRNVSQNFK